MHFDFLIDYLDVLDDKEKFLLVKFMTSNHRLPIEVGRWRNIKRENRICNLCNGRKIIYWRLFFIFGILSETANFYQLPDERLLTYLA
jgi:hypothetical protein